MQAPIKGFNPKLYPKGHITQFYGENKELYKANVCSGEGCMWGGHNGIDIVSPWGTPIFAVEDCIVVEVKDSATGYGKMVRAVNVEAGHEWTYGHLSEIKVTLNQLIKAGDNIGLMGNTGFVVSGATPYWKNNPYAGTHLHLNLRLIKKEAKKSNTSYPNGLQVTVLNHDNGCFGGVDWLPIYLGTTPDDPDDVKKIQGLQLTVISLANQAISLLNQLIKAKGG